MRRLVAELLRALARWLDGPRYLSELSNDEVDALARAKVRPARRSTRRG